MTAPKKAAAPKTRGRPAPPSRVYKPKGQITATLKLHGRIYEARGETVMAALEGLTRDTHQRGTAILTVSNGTQTVERIIQPVFVERLFSMSPLTRQVQLKNLYLLIGL